MQKQYISWCIILLLVFVYPLAARAALSNVVIGLQNGVGDVVEFYGETLELILDARETALYNLNRVFAISIDAAGMWSALKSALQEGYHYTLNTTEDVLRAIGYLFGDWITDADLLANNVYESAAAHCYVSEDGKLYIDGDFVDYVDNFLQWLWDADGANLSEYAPMVPVSPDDPIYNDNGIRSIVYIAPAGSGAAAASAWIGHSGDASFPYTAVVNGTQITLTRYNGMVYYCNSNLRTINLYKFNSTDSGGGVRTGISVVQNSSTWRVLDADANAYYDLVPMSSVDPINQVWQGNIETTEEPEGDPDIFSGMTSASIDLSTYYDITATETPAAGDWTITPKQLVQAVAESIAGDQSEQQITAVDGTGAQTVVVATPTGAELKPVEGAPASGSSNFPTITTPTIDGNWNGVEGFEIDLSGVFPFCIPFDIYKLFSKLSVEPVTPVFEIPVAVLEREGIYETVTVDLSPFDDFAASVRTVEKLAILVAVGVLSYKMIFGGD